MSLVYSAIGWIENKAEVKAEKTRSYSQSARLSLLKVLLTVLIGFVSLLCLTVPFDWQAQVIFVLLLWSMAMVIRRLPGGVYPTYY